MGMIAAVANQSGPPCIIKYVGSNFLSVKAITYCAASHDASNGVLQLPDDSDFCERCKFSVKLMARQPRST